MEPLPQLSDPHDPASPRLRRPIELIVVIVLTYLSALGAVGLGIVVIFARYDEDVIADGVVAHITLLGAGLILLGLLIAAMAGGITRGDRTARSILTVLFGLQVLLHAWSLALNPDDLWGQVFPIAVALASIIVLWTGRTARWFASAHPGAAGTSGGTTAPARGR